MLLFPALILLLLLAGMLAVWAVSRLHPRFVQETATATITVAAATVAMAGLAWLAVGGRLPIRYTLSQWPPFVQLPPWTWHIDETAWLLSALLLLLVTAVFIVHIADGKRVDSPSAAGPAPSPLPALISLALTAAALIALWAESLAGFMAGWTLLAFVWLLLLFAARPPGHTHSTAPRLMTRLGTILLSLFFLWLAAATLPPALIQGNLMSDLATWPTTATRWLWMAALLQLGIFPLHLWRPLQWALPPTMAALAHIVPSLVGLSLLARLVTAVDIGQGMTLLLTALGLFGLLAGVGMALSLTHRPKRVTAVLSLTHASLALLAGLWAGTDALLSEGRVLVLAIGVLFLVTAYPHKSRPTWLAIGPFVALAALSGLPLTAGFNGRSALYNAWLADGRLILVLVTALIHIPLFAAALRVAWPDYTNFFTAKGKESPEDEQMAGPAPINTATLMYGLGLLLPILGLISLSGLTGEVRIVTWLALLTPPVAALFLSRYLGETQEIWATIRQTVTLNLPVQQFYEPVARAAAVVGAAFREAAAILEGEGGMLWLLLFLAVFWLAWPW